MNDEKEMLDKETPTYTYCQHLIHKSHPLLPHLFVNRASNHVRHVILASNILTSMKYPKREGRVSREEEAQKDPLCATHLHKRSANLISICPCVVIDFLLFCVARVRHEPRHHGKRHLDMPPQREREGKGWGSFTKRRQRSRASQGPMS